MSKTTKKPTLPPGVSMDDECLISMVRDKECLYNYSSSLYKNTILKANCWEEIAQALLPVPERISLQEAVNYVKFKWGYLRDTLVRNRRKHDPASGAGAQAEPKWAHWKIMQWLTPYLARNSTTSNIESSECSLESDELDSPPNESVVERKPLSSPSASSKLTSPSASSRPKRQRSASGKAESSFEALLAHELAQVNKDRQEDDEEARFGAEVAHGIRQIQDPYTRAVAMRSIRDIIFQHRFSSHNPQPTQQHMPTSTYTHPTQIPPTQYHPPTTPGYQPYLHPQ